MILGHVQVYVMQFKEACLDEKWKAFSDFCEPSSTVFPSVVLWCWSCYTLGYCVLLVATDLLNLVPVEISNSFPLIHWKRSNTLVWIRYISAVLCDAGERTGCVLVLTSSAEEAVVVESHLKRIIRPLWSNPPLHGARIATEILTDPQLYEEWCVHVSAGASVRLLAMHVCLS